MRLDPMRLDPMRLQPARQPEAVATGFEGNRNPRDRAAGPDRLIARKQGMLAWSGQSGPVLPDFRARANDVPAGHIEIYFRPSRIGLLLDVAAPLLGAPEDEAQILCRRPRTTTPWLD